MHIFNLIPVVLLAASASIGANDTVFFERGSARAPATTIPDLSTVRGPVRFTGYASPEGTEAYNERLSRERADFVARISGAQSPVIVAGGELRDTPWADARKVVISHMGASHPEFVPYAESAAKGMPQILEVRGSR